MIVWDGMDIVSLIFLCSFTIIVFLVTIIYMLVQTIKRHFRKKEVIRMQGKRNSLYANSPVWNEWRKICSKLKKHPEIFNMKLVPERASQAYEIMKKEGI